MLRALATGAVVLASSACLHSSVPVSVAPGMDAAPLEARIWSTGVRASDISIRLSRPAHVAVFEIVPGRGTQLLYPRLGQPQLLHAGSNYPHLFLPPGSRSRISSFAAASHTPSSWMQPRHLFLVASASPLALDAMRLVSEGRDGHLIHPRFASFSANSIMSNLVDAVVPMGADEWVTDVYTIWPEPPPVQRGRVPTNVLLQTVWLLCGDAVIAVPAGTPVGHVQNYLNHGCRITQPPPPAGEAETTPDSAQATPVPVTPLRPTRPDTLRSTPPQRLDSLRHKQADAEGSPRSPRADPVERGGPERGWTERGVGEGADAGFRTRAPAARGGGQDDSEGRVAGRERTETGERARGGGPSEATRGRTTQPTGARPTDRVAEPVTRARPSDQGRRSTPQARTRDNENQRGGSAREQPQASRPSAPPVDRARDAQPTPRPAAQPIEPRRADPAPSRPPSGETRAATPRAESPPPRAEQPPRREPPPPAEPPTRQR